MAQIEWNEKYSIDDGGTIDKQHKRWFDFYNKLDKVLMETSPTEIAKTKVEALQAMQEYGIYHFRSEENFMKSIGYPDLPHHWRLHKDFDYKVFHYIREIETGEVVKNTEIIAFLREWLIDHVMKEDMKIRQFLKKNSVSKETIQDQ